MPYGPKEVRARDILARILLASYPKAGKTVCSVLTAPGPTFVFNTDGMGALDPVILLGGENWEAEEIKSYKDFPKIYFWLKQNMRFRTVVFDQLSTMALIVENEVRKDLGRDDPRVIYPAIKRIIVDIVLQLNSLPCHVIYCSNTKPDQQVGAGVFDHILDLGGGAQITVPALAQDHIWLEVKVDPNSGAVSRELWLAPQGNWKKGVRSIRDLSAMEADIGKYIEYCRTIGVSKPLQNGNAVHAQEASIPTQPSDDGAVLSAAVVSTAQQGIAAAASPSIPMYTPKGAKK